MKYALDEVRMEIFRKEQLNEEKLARAYDVREQVTLLLDEVDLTISTLEDDATDIKEAEQALYEAERQVEKIRCLVEDL